MPVSLTPDMLRQAMLTVAETIIEKRDELSRIDSFIGDGDHGVGLSRGFTAARDQLAASSDTEISKLMRTFGLGVVTGAGGASGPLFGGIFMEGGKTAQGLTAFKAADVTKWWRAALDYIQAKGKAQPGDKTMVDALHPAVLVMEAFPGDDIGDLFAAAAKAAWEGVEKTKNMVAGQGRSRYLGERSVGHQDAGATSVAIILDVFRDFCVADGCFGSEQP